MLQQTSPSGLGPDTAPEHDARYFEYTSSANPLGAKLITRVPYHVFPASLYADGPTRVVPLDLSRELGCAGPATGPGLCASFVRIVAGENVTLAPVATSQVFYVIDGNGAATQANVTLRFGKGDFFAYPGGQPLRLRADSTARLYAVDDAPLLAYLGAGVSAARFRPTHYPASRAEAELRKVAGAAAASARNRVSILLGNANFPQTRTVTHTLWAMFGVIAPGTVQKPHRHQSIALDFISDCAPGCYTLVGTELDPDGRIVDAERVDWTPGVAFVTPPGYWHAHFNESGTNGYVIPIQDAGLQTWLRSLDIRFAR